jgi:hypothetical protein
MLGKAGRPDPARECAGSGICWRGLTGVAAGDYRALGEAEHVGA